MQKSTCYLLGLSVSCCLGLVAGLVGCDQDDIQSHQVPKTASPRPAPPAMAPATNRPPAGPRMDWTVPNGWQPVPGSRQMRIATFTAGDQPDTIEIAVSAFPGDVGGLLANVNRWRGQLQLQPITEPDLSNHLVPFDHAQLRGFIVDMTAPASDAPTESAKQLIGAIIPSPDGMTWFVKAMGQSSLVLNHKADIVAFAQSFRPPALAQAPQQEHQHEPTPNQDQPHAHDHAPWHKPPHWQPDPNPSPIVAVAFNIQNPAGQARVTVTTLAGTGGGELANINRWRQQIGLPPVTTLQDQPVRLLGDQPGRQAKVIDLLATTPGPDGQKRFLIAMLPVQGKTWFFKLTGTDAAVEMEIQAFEHLVSSMH